ncbi:MAG: hypothetical protein JJU16_01245 [Alkalibacterium sp.]|nr:hypothetical protein [Alkalibacterium sp.]
MNKKDVNELTILDTDYVKVIPTQRNVDIRYTEKNKETSSNGTGTTIAKQEYEPVKRLTKDTYLDPVSKTVKNYRHKVKRVENETTFYRTKRELNWLILNSFEGDSNELFITLTYRKAVENHTDLNKHFRNFIRRLATQFKKNVTFDYIVVREPHLSGNWHMHVLFKYFAANSSISLPHSINEWTDLIAEKWKLGFVHVKAIEEVNQLAVYLTKHLMDIAVDENGEEIESMADSMSTTAIAKNKRLDLYPLNCKIYSYSKGIKKPPKLYMTYAECKNRYGSDYEKNWDNSFLLYNDNFALLQRQIQFTRKE